MSIQLDHSKSSIQQQKKSLVLNQFTSNDLWGNYHKGVLSGLNQDFPSMSLCFQKLLSMKPSYEWITELRNNTATLLTKTHSFELFQETMTQIITNSRALKKLPKMDWNFR